MSQFLIRTLILSLVLAAPAWLRADPVESVSPLPHVLFNYAAAVDSRSGKIVVFGGAEPGGTAGNRTLIYDPSSGRWEQVNTAATPPGRTHHQMAYLPDKRRVIMFGGRDADGNYLDDTWLFTGKTWRRIKADPHPGPRGSAALAAAATGDALILFGGFSPELGDRDDTWRFDGARWKRLNPATAPPPRSMATLTPFPASDGVVLFGGFGPNPAQAGQLIDLDDTWTFDGSDWTRRTLAHSPAPRSGHTAALDPKSQQVLLAGGISRGAPNRDVWRFDGSDWRMAPTASVKPQAGHIKLIADARRGRVYAVTLPEKNDDVANDVKSSAYLNDTWLYSQQQWKQAKTELSPKQRSYSAMVFDDRRERCVLFGGSTRDAIALDDTWEFDGNAWRLAPSALRPSPRFDHKMVYDSVSGRAILFGGFGPGPTGDANRADTWVFDGTRWLELLLVTSPPPRSRHAMTYDSLRKKVWLFGGYSAATGEFNDLWTFDGKDWSEVKAADPPTPRSSGALAFHPPDGRLYLFGGHSKGRGALGDTWCFDPKTSSWSPVETQDIPAPRQDAGFVFDKATGALTLFGGFDGKRDLADLWVFTGDAWKEIKTRGPVARSYFSFCYDRTHQQAVLFGGYGIASVGAPGTAVLAPSKKPGTWEFDGKRWQRIATAQRPTADLSYGMAYDPKRKVVVLFGGYNEARGELDETWLYDGRSWTWVRTPVHPGPRTNASMIFDPVRKNVLCYGGYHPEKGSLNDLWAFDGSTWRKLPIVSPYSNYTGGSAMVYDSHRKVFVYYGGRSKD